MLKPTKRNPPLVSKLQILAQIIIMAISTISAAINRQLTGRNIVNPPGK